MKIKSINKLLFLTLFVLMGCAHNVEFRSPDMYQYEKPVPLKAIFYMDKNIKDNMWSGRAVSSGIANRWDVPIGNVVLQYANAYLKNGFKVFIEVETLATKPTHDILIKVTNLNYYMANQAAHCDLTFVVENSLQEQVLNKKYHADGPSGLGMVAAVGVFAQKSAIRQSTHVVLENILRQLLADIQANYKDWGQLQPQLQTPPQTTDTYKGLVVSASEYNNRGFEYHKNAQYKQAIEHFTIALSMEKNSFYYVNRGSSFYELKQYDNAISDFKHAINLAPNEAGAYAWCGNVYYVKKSYHEASEYFSKAIAIVPNNAVFYLNRGYAQFNIGNKSTAVSDFKKACELGNEDGCRQLKVLGNK